MRIGNFKGPDPKKRRAVISRLEEMAEARIAARANHVPKAETKQPKAKTISPEQQRNRKLVEEVDLQMRLSIEGPTINVLPREERQLDGKLKGHEVPGGWSITTIGPSLVQPIYIVRGCDRCGGTLASVRDGGGHECINCARARYVGRFLSGILLLGSGALIAGFELTQLPVAYV